MTSSLLLAAALVLTAATSLRAALVTARMVALVTAGMGPEAERRDGLRDIRTW